MVSLPLCSETTGYLETSCWPMTFWFDDFYLVLFSCRETGVGHTLRTALAWADHQVLVLQRQNTTNKYKRQGALSLCSISRYCGNPKAPKATKVFFSARSILDLIPLRCLSTPVLWMAVTSAMLFLIRIKLSSAEDYSRIRFAYVVCCSLAQDCIGNACRFRHSCCEST